MEKTKPLGIVVPGERPAFICTYRTKVPLPQNMSGGRGVSMPKYAQTQVITSLWCTSIWFTTCHRALSSKKTTLVQQTNAVFFVVTRTGLEPMLPPWKGGVLTTWPTGLVAAIWFEQMTYRVWTECSSQLSYTAICPPQMSNLYYIINSPLVNSFCVFL